MSQYLGYLFVCLFDILYLVISLNSCPLNISPLKLCGKNGFKIVFNCVTRKHTLRCRGCIENCYGRHTYHEGMEPGDDNSGELLLHEVQNGYRVSHSNFLGGLRQ